MSAKIVRGVAKRGMKWKIDKSFRKITDFFPIVEHTFRAISPLQVTENEKGKSGLVAKKKKGRPQKSKAIFGGNSTDTNLKKRGKNKRQRPEVMNEGHCTNPDNENGLVIKKRRGRPPKPKAISGKNSPNAGSRAKPKWEKKKMERPGTIKKHTNRNWANSKPKFIITSARPFKSTKQIANAPSVSDNVSSSDFPNTVWSRSDSQSVSGNSIIFKQENSKTTEKSSSYLCSPEVSSLEPHQSHQQNFNNNDLNNSNFFSSFNNAEPEQKPQIIENPLADFDISQFSNTASEQQEANKKDAEKFKSVDDLFKWMEENCDSNSDLPTTGELGQSSNSNSDGFIDFQYNFVAEGSEHLEIRDSCEEESPGQVETSSRTCNPEDLIDSESNNHVAKANENHQKSIETETESARAMPLLMTEDEESENEDEPNENRQVNNNRIEIESSSHVESSDRIKNVDAQTRNPEDLIDSESNNNVAEGNENCQESIDFYPKYDIRKSIIDRYNSKLDEMKEALIPHHRNWGMSTLTLLRDIQERERKQKGGILVRNRAKKQNKHVRFSDIVLFNE